MNSTKSLVPVSGFKPNPQQLAVIQAGQDEQLLVVAGPGTGKTQVAAMRLVHLLRNGLRPAQILVLSFSRSAVGTLTKRIKGLQLDDEELVEELRHLSIRTFDSWAFRVLRQAGGVVADLLSHSHDDNISALTVLIQDDKNEAIAARLESIRHVIVDEFQDLPGVRSEMVIELLLRLTRQQQHPVGFTVLGDPAQAIFRFAARAKGQESPSDPWQELKARLGKGLHEIELSKNHRSTEVLAGYAANMRKILQSPLIAPEKKLDAVRGFLDRLPASDPKAKLAPPWLDHVPEGSVAILTRTNGEAMRVATMLMGSSVEPPAVSVRLHLAGSRPHPPAWVAMLLSRFKPRSVSRSVFDTIYSKALEQLDEPMRAALHIPPIEIAWRRLAHASGTSDVATSIDLDVLRERLEWPDSFPDDQIPDEAAVFITTIHQAKGMEFDNVALLELQEREGAIPAEDPLEEANVGFVAITRAGNHLGRLPSSCIYKAPFEWKSRHGRSRLLSYGKMFNFQIGIAGDIDLTSFVSSLLHGGDAHVATLQSDLGHKIARLRGHKVILVKATEHIESKRARDARYDIHLQDGDQPGLLLGRTTQQLTYDLLELLWNMGRSLPYKIYNLRISDVVTVAGSDELPDKVPDPWHSSRFWLGVTLTGTGDFIAGKRNGG